MRPEKRSRPRRSLSYRARLVSTDGRQHFDCTFADISETGARLVVEDPDAIPDSVRLLLAQGRGIHRHCEVVWRAKDRIGVRFLAAPKP